MGKHRELHGVPRNIGRSTGFRVPILDLHNRLLRHKARAYVEEELCCLADAAFHTPTADKRLQLAIRSPTDGVLFCTATSERVSGGVRCIRQYSLGERWSIAIGFSVGGSCV